MLVTFESVQYPSSYVLTHNYRLHNNVYACTVAVKYTEFIFGQGSTEHLNKDNDHITRCLKQQTNKTFLTVQQLSMCNCNCILNCNINRDSHIRKLLFFYIKDTKKNSKASNIRIHPRNVYWFNNAISICKSTNSSRPQTGFIKECSRKMAVTIKEIK